MSMMRRALEVVEVAEDGNRVLYARGELDLDSIPDVREHVNRSRGNRRTILDLSGLTFIDVTGIRFLIEAQDDAEASGRKLVLRNPSARVRATIRISGLLAYLRLSTD